VGEIEERHQDEGGEPEGARDRPQPRGVDGPEGRDEDDEHHHREVFHECDPDHDAAVPRPELAGIHEQAREDHGARHRHYDADDRPLQQGPAHDGGRPHAEGDGEQNAEGAAENGHALDAQKIAQRELHADREHEEDDADLGEELEGVQVGNGRSRREGADKDAAEDVPEDEGLPGRPRGGGAEDARRRRRRDPGKTARRRPWRADDSTVAMAHSAAAPARARPAIAHRAGKPKDYSLARPDPKGRTSVHHERLPRDVARDQT
jgi:hypothetical protein